MKIIDISWPISQATTGYKDKNIVELAETKNFAKDGARETKLCFSSHTGTHVDAPSHFLQDGLTIDQIALARLVGPAKVLDLTTVDNAQITGDDLAQYASEIKPGDIILLKTTNSLCSPTDKFNMNFVHLEVSGARYLAKRGVSAVGIDYLGIERNQPDHSTHTTLMHADILVIEGLRLGHVNPGPYHLTCLPLAIIGVEAAPARAILISE